MLVSVNLLRTVRSTCLRVSSNFWPSCPGGCKLLDDYVLLATLLLFVLYDSSFDSYGFLVFYLSFFPSLGLYWFLGFCYTLVVAH